MTTELSLQNSISLQEQTQARKKLAAKKDVDYKKYQVGATAYAPKGHLINDPLWKAPINEVKDTFQNVKNIGKGLKGDGNDHNLGMMNDLTMKAGGLALAGYLATRRALPVQKGMEFVGFASFFASMVLWPKVFINAPIKALYGFNVDQKCVDSQGRKNNVHRDPQYFVSDLYSSEQLDAIGDKMGINKDMENRQGLVKEKMTKISTQANTLWMLTAGLATPIMGALISSQAEKGLNLLHQKHSTQQVDKKLEALGVKLSKSETVVDQKSVDNLNAFLTTNKDKNVDSKFVDTLTKMIAGDDNLIIKKDYLNNDLKALLESDKVADASAVFGDIKIGAPGVDNFSLKQSEIKKALQDQGLNDHIVPGEHKDSIVSSITELFNSKIFGLKEADATALGLKLGTEDELVAQRLRESLRKTLATKFAQTPMILTEEKIKKIADVHKSFSSFRANASVLNEYINRKVGNTEDSIIAREWGKATNGISKALGFSDKELAVAKDSPTSAREVMDAKLTAVAQSDKYESVAIKVAENLSDFNGEVTRGAIKDKDGQVKDFLTGVSDATKTIYSALGEQLSAKGFSRTADYIAGDKGNAATNVIESVDNSVIGANASLNKVLHALDTYKRLQTGEIEKSLKEDGRSDDHIKNVVGVVKYCLMDGTLGSHSVKFDLHDKEVYVDAFNVLYAQKGDLHPSTKKALGEAAKKRLQVTAKQAPTEAELKEAATKAVNGFKAYLNDSAKYFGDARDRFKTQHFLTSSLSEEADKTTLKKQMMAGETLSNLTRKMAEQKSNTTHWLKLFGGIGAGVAAITLVAPLFFGKIEEPKQVKKEVASNG